MSSHRQASVCVVLLCLKEIRKSIKHIKQTKSKGEKKMKEKHASHLLLQIMKILKRYIHIKDQSLYLTLGLFILQTYRFHNFENQTK